MRLKFSCALCDVSWPRHPATVVPCPDCKAPTNAVCKRPSGHVIPGGDVHVTRERAAVDAGLLSICPRSSDTAKRSIELPTATIKPRRTTMNKKAAKTKTSRKARAAKTTSRKRAAAKTTRSPARTAVLAKPSPSGRKAEVAALMRRSEGVTTAQIKVLTGMLEHSARALISGITKGLAKTETVVKTKDGNNATVYAIRPAPAK